MNVFRRHWEPLLAAGVFILATLLAWPAGDFPLNDDWTYAKSLVRLQKDGVIDLGTSSSALVTQLYYGLLFIKIFGFSFTILRISTWLSVFVFIVVLHKVLANIQIHGWLLVFFTLCLVLNPIYFSLSHTFMTDVNFCTLLLCCLWQAMVFHQEKRLPAFALFFLFSALLIFLRQFGLLVPFAFLASCITTRQRRLFWTGASLVVCLLLYLAFSLFETSAAAKSSIFYHGSQQQDLFGTSFWNTLLANCKVRGGSLYANVAVWMLPFSLVLFFPLWRKASLMQRITSAFGSALLCTLVYSPRVFPLGNVFANMSLGAETFYESLIWPGDPFPHTFSAEFMTALQVAQVSSMFFFSWVALLFIVLLASGNIKMRFRSLAILLCVFMAGYVVMLFVPEMFLDRYLLPLLLCLGLLMVIADVEVRVTWPALAVFLIFVYVAVAGTRDYFTLNRFRWSANVHLRNELRVPVEKINGGYEVNCWHEGANFNWYDHTQLANHEYLVQYRPEKDFVMYKAFPFYRFLSLKTDTLYIYKRLHE